MTIHRHGPVALLLMMLSLLACGGSPRPVDEALADESIVAAELPSEADKGAPPKKIVTGQDSPRMIEIDDKYIFWIEHWGYLKRMNRKTGTIAHIECCSVGDLVLDATHVYWTADDGRIRRMPKGGGGIVTIAKNPNDEWSGAGSITLDDTHVYWTNFFDGTVVRIRKDGTGGKDVIASGQETPEDVVLSGSYAYFTTFNPGEVKRVKKTGGSVKKIASHQDHPFDLVVDDSRVYWTSGKSVKSAPKSGGATKTLTTQSSTVYALAVDSSRVYFTTKGGSVKKMKKNGDDKRFVAYGQGRAFDIDLYGNYAYFADFDHGTILRSAK